MSQKMRNPEAWYGKKAPSNLEWEPHWKVIDKCDDCQCFARPEDLHPLFYPQSEADWGLQETLHVEEAQSFCPACLAAIEREADKVDPEWRKRHGLE